MGAGHRGLGRGRKSRGQTGDCWCLENLTSGSYKVWPLHLVLGSSFKCNKRQTGLEMKCRNLETNYSQKNCRMPNLEIFSWRSSRRCRNNSNYLFIWNNKWQQSDSQDMKTRTTICSDTDSGRKYHYNNWWLSTCLALRWSTVWKEGKKSEKFGEFVVKSINKNAEKSKLFLQHKCRYFQFSWKYF